MGRKVWVPVVSGPLAPYAAGFCVVAGVSGVLALGGGGQAVSVRSAQPLAGARGTWRGRADRRAGRAVRRGRVARRAWCRGPRRAAWRCRWSICGSWGSRRHRHRSARTARWRSCWPTTAAICRSSAGCRDHTVLDAYVPAARLFLSRAGRARTGWIWQRLAAADVSSFLARECPKRSVSGSARSGLRAAVVVALPAPGGADRRRRWCGRCPRSPICAIARCRAVWNRPRSRRLLAAVIGAGWSAGVTSRSCCCWRGWGCGPARSPRSRSTTSTGGRGLLLVHGKGGREDALPLPVDVGEAIVSYLRRRPRCECRALFLRVTAPRQGLNRCTVAWVVRAACDRAGLPRVGAHRLRHTAATADAAGRARRCPRSVRCCVIASRRPPRSTPRSTARRCGRWPARGPRRAGAS